MFGLNFHRNVFIRDKKGKMFWKEIFNVFLLNNEKTDGNPPLAPVSNKEFIPFLISVRQLSGLLNKRSEKYLFYSSLPTKYGQIIIIKRKMVKSTSSTGGLSTADYKTEHWYSVVIQQNNLSDFKSRFHGK